MWNFVSLYVGVTPSETLSLEGLPHRLLLCNFMHALLLYQGNVVQKLGTLANPWIITASLRNGSGDSSARLLGSTTAKYHNGWANFTDLAVSRFGVDYVMDFAVTYPAGAGYSFSSTKFTLKKRPLKVNVRNITSNIVENSAITMEIELQDQVTSEVVKQINWRVWW